LMVLGRGMRLAPRGIMQRLGWHHAGHPWCLLALGDHPGVSGTISGHGDHPRFLLACGPSWVREDHARCLPAWGPSWVSGTIPGHGDHPRLLLAWRPSWVLGDHARCLLCLGTILGSQGPSLDMVLPSLGTILGS